MHGKGFTSSSIEQLSAQYEQKLSKSTQLAEDTVDTAVLLIGVVVTCGCRHKLQVFWHGWIGVPIKRWQWLDQWSQLGSISKQSKYDTGLLEIVVGIIELDDLVVVMGILVVVLIYRLFVEKKDWLLVVVMLFIGKLQSLQLNLHATVNSTPFIYEPFKLQCSGS